MNKPEHTKHTKLTKPSGGQFHAIEIAFIGAPCGMIQSLGKAVAEELADLKIGFVDADHSADQPFETFAVEYTDKISHHQLSFNSEHIDYEFTNHLLPADLVLVNGNHFTSDCQAVIINDKKKDSLQRKLEKLTQVKFFILDEDHDDIHEFLKAHNPAFADLPKYKIDDIPAIAAAIRNLHHTPKLKGLVLAGGKSSRMGEDKSLITYHGKPQRLHLAEMLSTFCEQTFISTQEPGEEAGFEFIQDTFTDLGPYGGILSAFRKDPNAAWLTVATDIPLLKNETIQMLVESRNPSKFATCFHNPNTGFPEPLITIWEPRAYPRLLHFLSRGFSCPRKALINSEMEEIYLKNPDEFFNANTPEEKHQIINKLNG